MEDPIKSVSWQNGQIVCRCCLAEGCYKDIGNEYFWMGKREVYEEMLSATFDIKISYGSSGGLTRPICEACISRLRDASEFKRQVLECEKMFIQQLAPGTSSTVDIQISPERTLKEVKIEGIVKVEKLEDSDDDGDGDVVFEDLPGADDDDDDMDDEPLMKFATKEPKKEKDLLKLLSGAGTSVVKRKSTTISTKASPSKRAKTEKPAPSSTKKMITIKRNPAPKAPPPKKKKEPEKKKETSALDTARWNAEILMKFSTVYPFRLPNVLMQCLYCDASFKGGGFEFRQHMKNEHKQYKRHKALSYLVGNNWLKLDCTEIKCRICHMNCATLQEIAHHLKDVHHAKLRLEESLDILPYICDSDKIQCGICFSHHQSLRHLGRHISSHFNKFTCESCGKSFINKTNMKYHLLSCTKGIFYCRRCKMIFDSPAERVEHVKQNEECWPYRCDYCDMRLYNAYIKQRHIREVHKVPPRDYPCLECKEVFKRKSDLRLHFKAIHKKDALLCPYCNKGFTSKDKLNDHVVTHTKEKPHVCTVCNKAFGTKKCLKQHSWLHSEIKRFECRVCDQKFNQRICWKSHMKSRHPDTTLNTTISS